VERIREIKNGLWLRRQGMKLRYLEKIAHFRSLEGTYREVRRLDQTTGGLREKSINHADRSEKREAALSGGKSIRGRAHGYTTKTRGFLGTLKIGCEAGYLTRRRRDKKKACP